MSFVSPPSLSISYKPLHLLLLCSVLSSPNVAQLFSNLLRNELTKYPEALSLICEKRIHGCHPSLLEISPEHEVSFVLSLYLNVYSLGKPSEPVFRGKKFLFQQKLGLFYLSKYATLRFHQMLTGPYNSVRQARRGLRRSHHLSKKFLRKLSCSPREASPSQKTPTNQLLSPINFLSFNTKSLECNCFLFSLFCRYKPRDWIISVSHIFDRHRRPAAVTFAIHGGNNYLGDDIPGGTCVSCKSSNGQRLSGDEQSKRLMESPQTRHPHPVENKSCTAQL
ncbi:Uncharacterized protein Rs2_38643 [Raphanus sativus]|nr:Uncharacterized protein Rs2_38643 [Raphanus sativus]